MNIHSAIIRGSKILNNNFIESPNLDAEILLAQAIQKDRKYILLNSNKELDNDGEFIKKWVPELKNLPINLVHEPWKINNFEEKIYDFYIGKSYRNRVVDIKETYKSASKSLWSFRRNDTVKLESKRILIRHTNSNRNPFIN